jgi:hypothetical protein
MIGRKRVIALALMLVAMAFSAAASDERKLQQKALDDAFAHLDKVTADHWDDPEASRWTNVGEIMSLASRNGSQLRLVAWTGKGNQTEPVYGFTDGELKTPCLGGDLTKRFRLEGVWLSFDVACVGGARVLAPHDAAASSAMRDSVRNKPLLVVEAPQGWKAEFDVRGFPVAEAMLRVMAVPAGPKKPDKPGPAPSVI